LKRSKTRLPGETNEEALEREGKEAQQEMTHGIIERELAKEGGVDRTALPPKPATQQFPK
jgi:hypothetical protein